MAADETAAPTGVRAGCRQLRVCFGRARRELFNTVTRLQSVLLVVGLLGAGTAAAVLRGSAARTAPVEQVAPAGTSAAELLLIARAQSALADGNPAQARSALREHGVRFPDGRLKVQRKLLEAYAERLEKGAP